MLVPFVLSFQTPTDQSYCSSPPHALLTRVSAFFVSPWRSVFSVTHTQTRVHTTPAQVLNHAHILHVSPLFVSHALLTRVPAFGGVPREVSWALFFCLFGHAHELAYTLLPTMLISYGVSFCFCVFREATTILTSEAYVDQIQQHVARLKGELKVHKIYTHRL